MKLKLEAVDVIALAFIIIFGALILLGKDIGGEYSNTFLYMICIIAAYYFGHKRPTQPEPPAFPVTPI